MGEGNWGDGDPHPPEVAQACLAMLARHEADANTYREQFVARFRLTKTGVTSISGVPIAGAQHAADGPSIEVSLPIAAAPAFMVAPVEELLAVVSMGPLPDDLPPALSSPLPEEKLDPRYTLLPLPEPLVFSTHEALRADYFNKWEFGPVPRLGRHYYWPASPDVVHVLSAPIAETAIDFGRFPPSRVRVVAKQHPLYRVVDRWGENVTIGVSAGARLITKYAGRVISDQHGISGLRGVIQRGADKHLFAYRPPHYSYMQGGRKPGFWYVLAVSPSGEVRTDVAEELFDGYFAFQAFDQDPTPFSDRDFHTFGLEGIRKGKPKTVRWIWHPDDRRYKITVEPPSQRVNRSDDLY